MIILIIIEEEARRQTLIDDMMHRAEAAEPAFLTPNEARKTFPQPRKGRDRRF